MRVTERGVAGWRTNGCRVTMAGAGRVGQGGMTDDCDGSRSLGRMSGGISIKSETLKYVRDPKKLSGLLTWWDLPDVWANKAVEAAGRNDRKA